MCRILEVGIGRYIRWKYHGASKKQQQIALLKENIISIFFRFKKYYGRGKIAHNKKWIHIFNAASIFFRDRFKPQREF